MGKTTAPRLRAKFQKPIIQEMTGSAPPISRWEPGATGWISAQDDALIIFGSSRHSLIEKWLSIPPFIGPVFIKTLFETIRQKERRVAYESIARLIAMTRPARSSFWDGGETEAVIIHVLVDEQPERRDICAFSTDILGNTPENVSSFLAALLARLGADRIDVRDETARKMLEPRTS